MVESEVAMRFDSLSLGLPFEARNYEHIPLFLSRALNVSDKMKILEAGKRRHKEDPGPRRKVTEILTDIAISQDAWLRDDVLIKDVKAKTPILQDINNMLESEYLRATTSGDDSLYADDGVLTYYEKIIMAYGFLQLPASIDTNPIYSPQPMALQEEDEEDDYGDESTLGSSPVIRTKSNQSSQNSLHYTNGSKRSPASNLRKRFLMFLGNINEPQTGDNTQFLQSSPEEPEAPKKHGFLLKTKLYSKIKKTRDLYSSFSSIISSPNSFTATSNRSLYLGTNRNSAMASNRNSVSTSTTSHSNVSRRRISTTLPTTPIDENRVYLYQQSSPVVISPVQRQENQRDKYEYYSQVLRTKQLVENLLILSERTPNIGAMIRFLEFIKVYVLRMVIVDMFHLTTSCSISKAWEMSRNPNGR